MADNPTPWIGVSAAVRHLEDDLRQAARSDAKTLLTGESGVGKEVVAKLIHEYSGRARRPFVAMNCAGLPDSLLESELFGHVRGSFTGAYRDKPGILEQGHGGTVFLDEVGEMSLRMQALLLRFLEDGHIHPVGAERSSSTVNVRIIAATNRVLLNRIAEGQFREDLYYRLNVIHLIIPPLRERRDDIAPLLQYYVGFFAAKYAMAEPALTADALAALQEYNWPGNVRELKNLAERLVVRCRSEFIGSHELQAAMFPGTQRAAETDGPTTFQAPETGELFERIVRGRESFWSAVYEPFMSRDITRADVRRLVSEGLQQTRGNYKMLLELFNMDPRDYKRLLNFLRKHHCHVAFQQFRSFDIVRSYPVTVPESEIA
jgi:transcriptional regulator with PAS, ATPase and Fis domain